MNEGYHNSVSSGTYKTSASNAALTHIPQFGVSSYMITGDDGTITRVILAPGRGLTRTDRERILTTNRAIFCSVRGDLGTYDPPSPADFHEEILRWAIRNARMLAIWSAPLQFPDPVAGWGTKLFWVIPCFVTLVEASKKHVSEWSTLVGRWKHPDASVHFFGPGEAGAIQ